MLTAHLLWCQFDVHITFQRVPVPSSRAAFSHWAGLMLPPHSRPNDATRHGTTVPAGSGAVRLSLLTTNVSTDVRCLHSCANTVSVMSVAMLSVCRVGSCVYWGLLRWAM